MGKKRNTTKTRTYPSITSFSLIVDTVFVAIFLYNTITAVLQSPRWLLIIFPFFLWWQFTLIRKNLAKIKRLRAHKNMMSKESGDIYFGSVLLFIAQWEPVREWIYHILADQFAMYYLQLGWILIQAAMVTSVLNILYVKIKILHVWGPQHEQIAK